MYIYMYIYIYIYMHIYPSSVVLRRDPSSSVVVRRRPWSSVVRGLSVRPSVRPYNIYRTSFDYSSRFLKHIIYQPSEHCFKMLKMLI